MSRRAPLSYITIIITYAFKNIYIFYYKLKIINRILKKNTFNYIY